MTTPGPWTAGYYLTGWAVMPGNAPGHPIARMSNFVTGETDAKFMAQSPHMFNLLLEAVEWAERVCEPPDWPSWLHEAKELIQRVEAK